MPDEGISGGETISGSEESANVPAASESVASDTATEATSQTVTPTETLTPATIETPDVSEVEKKATETEKEIIPLEVSGVEIYGNSKSLDNYDVFIADDGIQIKGVVNKNSQVIVYSGDEILTNTQEVGRWEISLNNIQEGSQTIRVEVIDSETNEKQEPLAENIIILTNEKYNTIEQNNLLTNDKTLDDIISSLSTPLEVKQLDFSEPTQAFDTNIYFKDDGVTINTETNRYAKVRISEGNTLLKEFLIDNTANQQTITLPEGKHSLKIEIVDILSNEIISTKENEFYVLTRENYNDLIAIGSFGDGGSVNFKELLEKLSNSGDEDKIAIKEDNWFSFGYWEDNGEAIDTWIEGSITPSEIIENYHIREVKVNYAGDIASIVNGERASGTFSFEVDFGNYNFKGNLQIDANQKWDVDISNGSLTPYGFKANSFSAGSNSEVDNISGKLSGKFYGPQAEAVGGRFDLSSSGGSAKGVFGGKAQ